MTLAEQLVRRWHRMPVDAIPDAILARAALCFEDTLGVAIAAAWLDVGTAATRVAAETGAGPARIWGTAHSVAASEAAFANGMLAHAMDYDDLHPAAIMHTSAVVVPAAIAMAQQVGASGREMLAAAVAGYEVAARLGRLAPGPFQQHGFQSTAILGAFAATLVATRLLRLDATQAVHALGIVGSMASGLMEFLADGSDVKQMHPGWSAHGGIRAAQLAAAGFTGPASIFEGRFGVYRSFARKDIGPIAPEDDAAEITHWEVCDMAPKPYPACLCVHPQVQAVLALRAQGVLASDVLDDIVEIRCDVPEFYVGLVYEPAERKSAVRTPYEGRFSAAYCMARAIVDGALELESFGVDKLADERVVSLARKVTYRAEALPEFPESFPARVSVIMKDGRVHEAYVAHNLGSPRNPFTSDHYAGKYRTCTERALGTSASLALLQATRALAEVGGETNFYAALNQARVQVH